jgi:hypothetical protein
MGWGEHRKNRILQNHSYPETHWRGKVSFENLDDIIRFIDRDNVDFGLQVAHDGRVWVCLDGIAFVRFKPER